MIGSWALQVAVRKAMVDAGIADGRIVDKDDAATLFPYVQIGETQTLSADVSNRSGSDEYLTLQVWDRVSDGGGHRGQKRVKEIADAIHTLFNGRSLTLSDRDTAFAVVRDFRTIEDSDGLTQRGVLTLRVQHFGHKES